MKYHYVRLKNNYSVILVLILALIIFSVSSTLTSGSSNSEIPLEEYTYNSYYLSDKLQVKEFDELYPTIVSNKNFETNSILLNGTITTVIQLPSNSTAIKLPDKRIALKYSNENISILPSGSTVVYYKNEPVVKISNQSTVLKVSELVDFPIENFTKTATFNQYVEKLDMYNVNIVFNELNNEIISDNIVNYSIFWGDGNYEIHDKEIKTVFHTFKKSGTYSLLVKVEDDFGITHQLQQNFTIEYEGHLLHTYYFLDENKEPVAISTSTGLSAFAIGLIALTETGKYKFLALLPLLIPLYTRIQKEDVLDQFVRGQIFGFIKTNPGVHYNQIRRGMDIKNGTLSYHLSVLEKTELIKSRREGLKYRAFYPTCMKFPQNERFRLTELQISILDIIKQRNGINQKEIAKEIGKKPQTVNYNIKVLKQADLIELVRKGRKTICFPKDDIEGSTTTAE